MGLRRSIGFISGSGLTIGAMVGSGIFMSPGEVLGAAELGLMYPESGGAYVYINEALGDLFAFLYAWSSILIVRPASAAIGAVSFADYMCEVFYEPGCAPSLLKKLIGMSLILFLGMVNAKSLKLSSLVSRDQQL
ncbi:Oidioi.mRNA.OKI2018_I69.XSR.g15012.t1.cds [Oikopleura dioica]|uniref:Oidioi.mRNA.OKI2018_I69.XSR.g15012.t1.cds n=1 Tax=Oikopleura dioica TaxID=34765 RepID=A0ABN7SGP0_OIKDI|nr:Oidioi.mRNA.OKI2018_I69.XSR.g15012.t1.cds [Oikopleura dioica]